MIDVLIIIIGIGLISFLFAPLGLGGGILYVPLLHYVGGWEIDQKLIIVSLLLSAVTSYGSGLEHRKQSFVDDRLTGIALWGAIPGALLGVFFVFITQSQFKGIFKTVSIIVVGFVIWKMYNKMNNTNNHASNNEKPELVKMTALSGFGGFLSSVMAIGAGMIYVPAMKFFGKLNPRKAIGSSLNIMMIVVPFAIITHYLILEKYQSQQLFDESILIISLVIVNFIGSKIGAIIGFKAFSEDILLKLFIAVLSITWLNYVIDVSSNLI